MRCAALLPLLSSLLLAGCPERHSDATAMVEDVWIAPGSTTAVMVYSEQANSNWYMVSDAPQIADVEAFGEFFDDTGLFLSFELTAERIGDTELRLYDERDALITVVRARVRAPNGMQLSQTCSGAICSAGSQIRVLDGESPRFGISYFVDTRTTGLRGVSGSGLVRMGNAGGSNASVGTDDDGDFVVFPAMPGTTYRASLSAPPNAFFTADVETIAADDAQLVLAVREDNVVPKTRGSASGFVLTVDDDPVFFQDITWRIDDAVVSTGLLFEYDQDPDAEPTELSVTIGSLSTTARIHLAR